MQLKPGSQYDDGITSIVSVTGKSIFHFSNYIPDGLDAGDAMLE